MLAVDGGWWVGWLVRWWLAEMFPKCVIVCLSLAVDRSRSVNYFTTPPRPLCTPQRWLPCARCARTYWATAPRTRSNRTAARRFSCSAARRSSCSAARRSSCSAARRSSCAAALRSYVLAVQRFAALVVQRLAALVVQRFAALVVQRLTAIVVKRFAALVVQRFAALAVQRFAALVVQRLAALVVKRLAALVVQRLAAFVFFDRNFSTPCGAATPTMMPVSGPSRQSAPCLGTSCLARYASAHRMAWRRRRPLSCRTGQAAEAVRAVAVAGHLPRCQSGRSERSSTIRLSRWR
jgi:hypothetical protein